MSEETNLTRRLFLRWSSTSHSNVVPKAGSSCPSLFLTTSGPPFQSPRKSTTNINTPSQTKSMPPSILKVTPSLPNHKWRSSAFLRPTKASWCCKRRRCRGRGAGRSKCAGVSKGREEIRTADDSLFIILKSLVIKSQLVWVHLLAFPSLRPFSTTLSNILPLLF